MLYCLPLSLVICFLCIHQVSFCTIHRICNHYGIFRAVSCNSHTGFRVFSLFRSFRSSFILPSHICSLSCLSTTLLFFALPWLSTSSPRYSFAGLCNAIALRCASIALLFKARLFHCCAFLFNAVAFPYISMPSLLAAIFLSFVLPLQNIARLCLCHYGLRYLDARLRFASPLIGFSSPLLVTSLRR